MAVIDNSTPKPTKGSGVLRFSEDIYLKFEYDLDSETDDAIKGYFHYGEKTITFTSGSEK